MRLSVLERAKFYAALIAEKFLCKKIKKIFKISNKIRISAVIKVKTKSRR